MKILTILLCLCATTVNAQNIDCTVQQHQVDQINRQIADNNSAIQAQLQQAEDNLNACLNVQTTVASPEYATAVQTIQSEKEMQPVQQVNEVAQPVSL